jgi:hypothetical protein
MDTIAKITTSLLPVVPVEELAEEESSRRWLIESLWGASAVGFCFGHPKLGKSWVGLDIAVSVSTGTHCLGKYPVHEPGGVLIYLAEDPPSALKERIECIARHRGLTLSELDLQVIKVPTLRLDLARDRERLSATVEYLRPRLLILDPLVRLHSLNENDSQAISELLSYLRQLQRNLDVALLLIHHARKNGTGGMHGGQGLRGSGDLWAWSDVNLYLHRVRGNLQLSIEHRSAPAPEPFFVELVTSDPRSIHLEVRDDPPEEKNDHSLLESVMEALGSEQPMTRQALRQKLSVKNERLGQALQFLEREGKVARSSNGWCLTS